MKPFVTHIQKIADSVGLGLGQEAAYKLLMCLGFSYLLLQGQFPS